MPLLVHNRAFLDLKPFRIDQQPDERLVDLALGAYPILLSAMDAGKKLIDISPSTARSECDAKE
jgi:hypothetical protein